MARNRCSGLSWIVIAGLAGVAVPSPAAPQSSVSSSTNSNHHHSSVISELHQAQHLLVTANHDYKGHRARAAEAVHHAIRELGAHRTAHSTPTSMPNKDMANAGTTSNAGSIHGTKPAHAAHQTHHESQAASDAQLRQAAQLLQQALPPLHASHPRAAANVRTALREVNHALAIR